MVADIEYIQSVLKGDATAFRYLVDRYQNMVFTLAYRIVRNREEAEDVAQEAFVKCFKALGRYNHQSKFSTWLYRITYNHAIDCLKRNGSRYATVELKDSIREDRRFSSSFETNIDQKILKGIVSDAIERLPAEDRIIVILYYYEDMPLKDIGEVVGIKENHVKIKLHRIRSKLMQYLQNKKEIISTIIEKK